MIHKNIFLIMSSAHDSEDIPLIYTILLSALLMATVFLALHFIGSFLQKRKYNRYLSILNAERQQKFDDIEEQIKKTKR